MSRREIKGSLENWRVINGDLLQSVAFDTIDHENLTLIGIFYSGRLLKGFIRDNTDGTILEGSDVILTEDGFHGSINFENRGTKTGHYDFHFNLVPGTYCEYKSDRLHMAGTLGPDRNLAHGFIHVIGVSWQQGDFKKQKLHGMGICHNYLSGSTARGLFSQGRLVRGEIHNPELGSITV